MGDRYAGFDAFVATRGSIIMRTASLLLADRTAAQKALEEALSRTALSWPVINREGSPEVFARAALYQLVVDRWRREHLLDVVPPGPAPTSLTLGAALARLSPRQRAAIVLREYENLSAAETAEILRCSVETVASLTRDALRRLRALAPQLAASLMTVESVERTEGESSAEVLS